LKIKGEIKNYLSRGVLKWLVVIVVVVVIGGGGSGGGGGWF
jgi:hypothetical protein